MDCGYNAPYYPTSTTCPKCNSQWREAEYDMAEVARTFPSEIKNRLFDLWRYEELLPIHNPNPTLRLGEGGTPLIQAANLGMMLGLPNLFIKDERQGPTSSFKDRQAAVTIAALKEGGVTEMVAASTGNVAISLSAYAARAGIKLPYDSIGIGLSWMLASRNGVQIVTHSGGDNGFRSDLLLAPDRQIGIVVMTNSEPRSLQQLSLNLLDTAAR